MDSYILMVFEGEVTEDQIVQNLKKYFLNESNTRIVKAIHKTVIYTLYQKFFSDGVLDEDIETFPLLKDMISDNGLKGIKREQVEQIYLFFDYDGHAPNANDDKLEKMLDLFNNETVNGKLYVSYPMVEAIKHLNDTTDFKDTVETSHRDYKKIVSENCDCHLQNLTQLKIEHWNKIIKEHSKKANFIVNGNYNFPDKVIEQKKILEKQKNKFIEPLNKVAVLSSFPLFLLDYYGVEKFK